jgi:hypothetical protein
MNNLLLEYIKEIIILEADPKVGTGKKPMNMRKKEKNLQKERQK